VTRRALPAAALAAGAAIVGCFELSAPASDLSAISPIAAAWPSVVVGDVLRDGEGNVAPLLVEAYDGGGNLVTDATVTFIPLDNWLRVDPDGVVHGETVQSTPARVVAQVRRGGDVLQTPEARIDVVSRPDSVAPGQDTTFAAKSVARFETAPISTELAVKVLSRRPGAPPQGVRSWIVRYEIIDDPPGTNDQPTAVFSGGGTTPVSVDTTDTGGLASRTVVLQTILLAPATGRQNVLVRVTVGNTRAGGAPTVFTITLPFDRQ
jgi:hypothetical protein